MTKYQGQNRQKHKEGRKTATPLYKQNDKDIGGERDRDKHIHTTHIQTPHLQQNYINNKY